MAETSKSVPDVRPQLAPFFEGARNGGLAVQKCDSCRGLRFSARAACPHCFSRLSSWVPVSGRTELFSFKLEEGPKIVSNPGGIGRQQVKYAMPVEVAFDKLSNEVSLHRFRPRSAE